MLFLDRRFALALAGYAGRVLIVALLIFMSLMVGAWWFSVLKFFFWDHWRITVSAIVLLAVWYGIGLSMQTKLDRGYLDYGDDA